MGRYDLGLTEEGFWRLTLREFNALVERYIINHDWLNYRVALVCSILANTARDPKKKPSPFVPDDFMPKKEQRQQTAEQMFAFVQALNAVLGGKVVEV